MTTRFVANLAVFAATSIMLMLGSGLIPFMAGASTPAQNPQNANNRCQTNTGDDNENQGDNSNAVNTSIQHFSAPTAIAVNCGNGDIYVTNSRSDSVSVIHGTNNKVKDNIALPSGFFPRAITYDPQNNNVYVSNYGGSEVAVLSASNNTVVKIISVPPSGNTVGFGIAYDSLNGNIYEVNEIFGQDPTVNVIDAATNTVTQSISIPNSFAPIAAGFNPKNGEIYLANDGSGNVSVINGTNNTFIKSISVGQVPYSLTFDSNGDVFVACLNSGYISVIDGATDTVTKTISSPAIPNPHVVAFDPSNGLLYLAGTDSNYPAPTLVSIINVSTNEVLKTISLPNAYSPQAIVFDSVNGRLYIANEYSNTISVIDSLTNRVIKTIT